MEELMRTPTWCLLVVAACAGAQREVESSLVDDRVAWRAENRIRELCFQIGRAHV
jgi:hypothetical protein